MAGAAAGTPASASAADVVREFWRRMATNDFAATAAVLSPDFVLEWPMSRERIRGPERFARMNAEYPAHGPWRFTLHRLVGGKAAGPAAAGEAAAAAADVDVVTDVSVTDGVQSARALSFFTVRDGRIVRLVEFWPEPYDAPAGRAHLVEPMGEDVRQSAGGLPTPGIEQA